MIIRRGLRSAEGFVTTRCYSMAMDNDWTPDACLSDDNGEPLILFHGGRKFDEFDTRPMKFRACQHPPPHHTWGVQQDIGANTWIWAGGGEASGFVSKESAEEYIANLSKVMPAYLTNDLHAAYGYASQYDESEAEIKPLYLKRCNLLDLRVPENFRHWMGVNDDCSPQIMARENFALRSGGKVIQRVQDQGYDGVIFHDTDIHDRGCHTAYAIFDPSKHLRLAPSFDGPEYYGYSIRSDGLPLSSRMSQNDRDTDIPTM